MVRAIVEVATGLGTQTIAESVEQPATLEYLRSCGVNLAQGCHLGPAGPLAELDLASPGP